MIEVLNNFVLSTMSFDMPWSVLISVIALILLYMVNDSDLQLTLFFVHFIAFVIFLSGFRDVYHPVTLIILLILFYVALFFFIAFIGFVRRRWRDS